MDTRDWTLWSCDCRLVVTDDAALPEAARIVDAITAEVELAASRFRADSEVRRLQPGWNELSPLLADLVRASLVAAWLSDGAVDPTVGAAMNRIGYDRDIATVRARKQTANPARIRLVHPAPGWEALRLDGERLFVPAKVVIDLGATAKAVAADRAAAAVREQLGTGVLVSLGGDIATAGGPDDGWQVTVQDLPDDVPQRITLAAGAAIATSSTARRTWYDGERVVHHVIDPATGRPTRGPWRTATVVAEDCARANTAATGALVKGDSAARWLRQLGLPTRLTDGSGHVRTLNAFPSEQAA